MDYMLIIISVHYKYPVGGTTFVTPEHRKNKNEKEYNRDRDDQ